jgi:hypothetical protein
MTSPTACKANSASSSADKECMSGHYRVLRFGGTVPAAGPGSGMSIVNVDFSRAAKRIIFNSGTSEGIGVRHASSLICIRFGLCLWGKL